MEKYDSNRDGEISLNEFYNLFLSINDLFNQFLDHDEDFSQSIEPNEQLQIKNNIVAITFDIYVRISARLDYLTNIGPKNQQDN
ncbi:hypothetical protein BpHYR1_001952 [Brachionus plicatilis]|uniref:EF-hand domain-containing protein n=1 Tax=Brachionus plicatilis TaxID=10195 RepID=A0A3M7RU55_BRAPC|nr:hypothetical protein BpHYR1_001952 [Brachionus plicatilis]